MPLELSTPPASTAQSHTHPGTVEPAPAPTEERPTDGPGRNSLLACAWHNVAEASRRIERLQARLVELGMVPSETSLS